MDVIIFDPVAFRLSFPEFKNETIYPDTLLELDFAEATCYVSDEDTGCLSGACRTLALYQLTAHIQRVKDQIAQGNDPGFISSASIDKVSISRMTPKESDQFKFYLNQTPYGQQLLALLKAKGAGGAFVGGINERGAFRQTGGFYITPIV